MAYPIQFIILYQFRHFVIRPILIYLQIVKNVEFVSIGSYLYKNIFFSY